jgi:hypothetical protein
MYKILLKYTALPLVLYIFLFALDLWKNYSDQAKHYADTYISPFFDYRLPLLVTILIAYWISLALIDYYSNKIKDTEDQLNSELRTQILLNRKYERYNKHDLLIAALETFVKKHSTVHAVQLYYYEVKHIGNKTRVKVSYEEGYIDEGIELNALDQSYYDCDKKMYSDFVKAKNAFDKGNHELLLQFLIKTRAELSSVSEPNDADAIKYSFVDLAVKLLEQKFDLSLNIFPEEKIGLFEEQKRTGVFRSILLRNTYFMFHHMALGLKQGRVYTARHLDLWNRKWAYLITFHPEILEDQSFEEQFRVVDAELMEKMKRLEYNNDTEGGHPDAER